MGMEQILQLVLPLIIIVVGFYFLAIRPESRKKKEAEAMRSQLAVGDEITTIGGILGTVCAVKDESLVIETGADRVRIEITKWAISTKNNTASTEKK